MTQNRIVLKIQNWPQWATNIPKTTLIYLASPYQSISAHILLGIILPITNYNLQKYNSAWTCSKFGMASIPARSKPRSCSPVVPPIFPVHILHLSTHKFISSRRWQEGKTFFYWVGSHLFVLGKRAWSSLAHLNSVSVFQVQAIFV